MRPRLFVAALLASTALSPVPAAAGPIGPFLQGIMAGIGVAAGGVNAAVASALGGAFNAGFVASSFLTTTFVGQTVLSLGLSAASQYLANRNAPPPSERMANFSQPMAFAEWVVGRTRKGGPPGFTGYKDGADVVTGQGGRKRHYSPVLAMHTCAGIVEHILDDKPVTIDADGTVQTEPFAGFYRIRPFTGQAGQVADPELVARFSEITAAHDFLGLTGAHIWARAAGQEEFSEVYPSGRQANYAPVIDGADTILDPRDGLRKWTRNAALIVAWWLTDIHGLTVDWDEVAEEATASDLACPLPGGGTQPRWRIDGVFSDEQTFEEQRAQIQAAADVWFYERPDGKVGFKVGRWIEPQITLTASDFLVLEWSQGGTGTSAPSEVSVQYIEPDNNYIESPTAPVPVDPDVRDKPEQPQAFLIASHNQAWRMAVRLAALAKPDFTLRGTVGIIGYYLIGERFLRVDHPVLGDVTVEVQRLARRADGFTFDLEAVAVTEADFAPDVSASEPPRPVYQVVASDDAIPDLSGLTATVEGTGIRIAWTDPADDSLIQQIRTRPTGSTSWQTIEVPAGQSDILIPGLAQGVAHEFQGRNRTSGFRVSDLWQPAPALTVTNTPAAVAIEDLVDPGPLFQAVPVTGWRDGPDITAQGDGTWWRNPPTGEIVTAAPWVLSVETGEYQLDQRARAIGKLIGLTRAGSGTWIDANGVRQTAATDVLRIDHASGFPALLVEGARTNIALHSEALDNAAWVKTNATVTANATEGADGALTADKLIATTANGSHLLGQSFSYVSGQTYCIAQDVKPAGLSVLNVRLDDFAFTGADRAVSFDLVNGVWSNFGKGTVAGMRRLGNGWWRTWVIATADNTVTHGGSIYWRLSNDHGAEFPTFAGDGVSGLYLSAFQVEVGAFPSSYIPTGAAAASRAADVAAMLGGAGRTLDLSVLYADGTTQALAGQTVTESPAFWPALTGTEIRRLVGRTP